MLIGIKVDVDTERGTRFGTKNLARLFQSLSIPATFLFSLGPDNTGRALKRIFRPGFIKKVSRTNVLKIYGLKTLLNGVLWPGPFIAKRHASLLRDIHKQGFEVGIHAFDHTYWQDSVNKLSQEKIDAEFSRAYSTFMTVFHFPAKTAGAPGWQANEKTLRAYDNKNLDYASDCRGTHPFYPKIKDTQFNTLQIPTTLPTLDEVLGTNINESVLVDYFINLLTPHAPNIFTIHAELEGMHYLPFLKKFIQTCLSKGFQFQTLETIAKKYLTEKNKVPICYLTQGFIEGRSGLLSLQGSEIFD
ncbi:MAG: polysaccharide deacetylase [Gammaproteobacteria bacterium RIFCSPLOWO2_02_FULL_38_11]|nr:MAG: polysaccharide deacetylase [Gammaproteobacteria bacterium RIFCSPLOWO2_02_FULL_38_11]OGT76654.1 MAG: polysaccharide deacetylase [Gammaproteobacteria bacterium RIFCSPLOWO2_12_FULL_38_14]